MADKYLKQNGGVLEEVEATSTSTGASEAGKIPALDAAGKLSETMMPTGIGADVKALATGETLAAGDLVYIDATGVWKADASTAGKEAVGFVLEGFTHPTTATVYFEGVITGLSGLTQNTTYFLSDTTPGDATGTAPTTSGYYVQRVGKAVSTTEISFEPAQPIKLA